MNDNKQYIYLASGLFNAGTNIYNALLCKYLEQTFDHCYLPQRDGFEVANFYSFLAAANAHYPPEVASKIAHYVPYYLDLGYFMSRSRAVVATLDDPVDVGMVVEISYARMCNIPVIGVRSDLRSPLGDVAAAIGINPFPVQQCDCFINADTPTGGYSEVYHGTGDIIRQIESKVAEWMDIKTNGMNESANPAIQTLLEGARILFAGIDDLHTHESMLKMADRFVQNAAFFDAAAPEIVSL